MFNLGRNSQQYPDADYINLYKKWVSLDNFPKYVTADLAVSLIENFQDKTLLKFMLKYKHIPYYLKSDGRTFFNYFNSIKYSIKTTDMVKLMAKRTLYTFSEDSFMYRTQLRVEFNNTLIETKTITDGDILHDKALADYYDNSNLKLVTWFK